LDSLVENIDIEFFIVKRKLYESEDYVIPRIQLFKPASGKIKVSRAEKAVNEFIKKYSHQKLNIEMIL
jgi:hypothetical protein